MEKDLSKDEKGKKREKERCKIKFKERRQEKGKMEMLIDEKFTQQGNKTLEDEVPFSSIPSLPNFNIVNNTNDASENNNVEVIDLEIDDHIADQSMDRTESTRHITEGLFSDKQLDNVSGKRVRD